MLDIRSLAIKIIQTLVNLKETSLYHLGFSVSLAAATKADKKKKGKAEKKDDDDDDDDEEQEEEKENEEEDEQLSVFAEEEKTPSWINSEGEETCAPSDAENHDVKKLVEEAEEEAAKPKAKATAKGKAKAKAAKSKATKDRKTRAKAKAKGKRKTVEDDEDDDLEGPEVGSTISTLLQYMIKTNCPSVIQGFSIFLGLFQMIMANPVRKRMMSWRICFPFRGMNQNLRPQRVSLPRRTRVTRRRKMRRTRMGRRKMRR